MVSLMSEARLSFGALRDVTMRSQATVSAAADLCARSGLGQIATLLGDVRADLGLVDHALAERDAANRMRGPAIADTRRRNAEAQSGAFRDQALELARLLRLAEPDIGLSALARRLIQAFGGAHVPAEDRLRHLLGEAERDGRLPCRPRRSSPSHADSATAKNRGAPAQ